MNTTKVLALRFKCENGKKYNVRIKDASAGASKPMIQKLADSIVKNKAFDFDGNQSAYTFESATYTTTEKQALISASENEAK